MREVRITLEQYEELLDLQTRVDVVAEIALEDTDVKAKDILKILGTHRSLIAAREIEEEERKWREKYLQKSKDSELCL